MPQRIHHEQHAPKVMARQKRKILALQTADTGDADITVAAEIFIQFRLGFLVEPGRQPGQLLAKIRFFGPPC